MQKTPSVFTHKRTQYGFEEYRHIKNGLTVLYSHDPTTPVVGVMVTYLVGSRHEAVGYTGATHLLEHLMFKGSKKFPPQKGIPVLDAFAKKGAEVNASTWLDRTNYYEVFPKEHLRFVLLLESDRMRNALITEKDLQEELPAVRSEYAMRTENDPEAFLEQSVWATAFMAHPYHSPTIGWQSDFETVSLSRLKQFYDTFYWPNNAVVTIVGDVSRKDALYMIEETFGIHPPAPNPIPIVYTKEPLQQGMRNVTIERAGTVKLSMLAFKVPEASHVDTPALLVLAQILGGSVTSRLHKALVEKGICASVSAQFHPFFDPSLFFLSAVLTKKSTHAEVEAVFWEECVRVQKKGVTHAECLRVQQGFETDMAFSRDGRYALLAGVNEAIAVGDWRFFFALPEKVRAVTPDDVQRVARLYCKESLATAGRYIPIT